MNRLSIQKKNIPLLAALYVFTVLRTFFVFDNIKTGLVLSDEFFINFGINITFDILTLIYCMIFSFIIVMAYEKSENDIIPLLVLIAADPKFTVLQADILETAIGILMFITIIIINVCSEKVGKIVFPAFCAISGLLLPMSLFCNIPIMCAVYYFKSYRKVRNPISLLPGLISFTAFSLLRIIAYKKYQFNFDTFMYTYSDGYDFNVSVGHTFYNKDIAVYALTAFSIALFIYGVIRKIKFLKSPNKLSVDLRNDIITVSILLFISVFGEIVYHKFSVCYLLILIVLLMLVKSNDAFALKIHNNLNSFVSSHFFVFIFILFVLASLCMNINGISNLFKTIGFDFIMY